MQRSGETQFKLNFTQGYYGPYLGKVRHVLYAMNGHYLRGFEQKDTKPFEPLELMIDKRPEVERYIESHLSKRELDSIQKVSSLIQGFETPYGLELLASVDFLKSTGTPPNTADIEKKMETWSNRKKRLFSKDHIEMALKTLEHME